MIIYRIDNLQGFDPGNDLVFGAGDQYLTWRESGQYGPTGICAGWVEVVGNDGMEPVSTLRLTGEAEFGPREHDWIMSIVASGWRSVSTGGLSYLHSKFHRVLDEPKDWDEFQSKLELLGELTNTPDGPRSHETNLGTAWARIRRETCQRLRYSSQAA